MQSSKIFFSFCLLKKKLYWNFLSNNNHHRVGKAFVGWSQISHKTSLFLVVFFTLLLAEPKEFRLIDPGPLSKEQSASIKIFFKRSRIVHQLTREIFFDSIKHPSRDKLYWVRSKEPSSERALSRISPIFMIYDFHIGSHGRFFSFATIFQIVVLSSLCVR